MGLTALGKANEKNTGKMGKILEKLMKKYWKNAKNTGKVYEKILEKCKKKTGKVREIRQSKKVGAMYVQTCGTTLTHVCNVSLPIFTTVKSELCNNSIFTIKRVTRPRIGHDVWDLVNDT